jgi:hypothetical protein
MLQNLRRLAAGNLEALPLTLLDTLTRGVRNLSRATQGIAQIDLSQPSYSHSQRDHAIGSFQEAYGNVASNISTALTLSESEKRLDLAEQEVAKIVDRIAFKEEEVRSKQIEVYQLESLSRSMQSELRSRANDRSFSLRAGSSQKSASPRESPSENRSRSFASPSDRFSR